jgi:hypothetical protein
MNRTIYKVGFWSGLIAFTATVAYIIVQLLQLHDVLTFPTDGTDEQKFPFQKKASIFSKEYYVACATVQQVAPNRH